MDWKATYDKWQQFSELDSDLREELKTLENDQDTLEDCFYTQLAFGTGGMRGKLGVGPNRMNIYTIRKAAAGLGQYILSHGETAKKQGVAIAYDSRHYSYAFALETAKTLGYLGIQSYLFDGVRSTPELSFAVRHLETFSGVVITASHNPSAYNGFKIYGSDGAQYANEAADKIVAHVNDVEDEWQIPVSTAETLKENGQLTIIGKEVDNAYQAQLQSVLLEPDSLAENAQSLRIVYTPLHGTGLVAVSHALSSAGFDHVQIVSEQAQPDGDFPTVEFPNPEEATAFELAIDYGGKTNADILLATDPDADRVGIAVKKEDTYHLLTGNQIGAVLLQYITSVEDELGILPNNGVIIKTIVTNELGKDIVASHGLETMDVLTGFKYIGEQIKLFKENGDKQFVFGYEESYGFLIDDFVREKDAVQTCLALAEAAAYYKSLDKSLLDVLEELYRAYGYYQEDLVALTLEGKQGVAQIEQILTDFREQPPSEIAEISVSVSEDYVQRERTFHETNDTEKITLPASNVLKYTLENGAWFCLRPSGTEPKVKIYFGVKEDSDEASAQMLETLKSDVIARVNASIAD